MMFLQEEIKKNKKWSKKECKRIAKATGLTETQVYKWNWN